MAVYQCFRIIFLFLIIIFSFSCKHLQRQSGLKTTSDRIKEYDYTIEGRIVIPAQIEPVLFGHLLDLVRKGLDHPDDQEEMASLAKILASKDSLLANFNTTYEKGWPILKNDGNVDNSKVAYWIARQIKYSTNVLPQKKIALTLNGDKSRLTFDAKLNGDVVEVNYRASFLAAAQHDFINSGPEGTPKLEIGEILRLPRNLIQNYYETITPSAATLFEQGRTDLVSGNLGPLVEKIRNHLQETRTLSLNPLLSTCQVNNTRDPISPFNYFAYFSPLLQTCKADLVDAKVQESQELPIKETFPEYHRLFADDRLHFFIFFNKVDDESPRAARSLSSYLVSSGYRVGDFNLEWIGDGSAKEPSVEAVTSEEFGIKRVTLLKKFGDVDFTVELVVADFFDRARTLFQQAIGGTEIVVYDGHAGYGANIDANFSIPESYPPRTYQIFVLNGCSTYKYGMSEILTAKAFRDFDFDNLNVDVVTTSGSTMGHTQHVLLLKILEIAAQYYDKNEATWSQEARDLLSWLGTITQINKETDRYPNQESFFMVSGEQRNQFVPGEFDYPIFEVKPVELEKIIFSEQYDVNIRLKATKIYIQKILEETGDINQAIGTIEGLCRKFDKDKIYELGLDNFYFNENCKVGYLKTAKKQNAVFDNLEFALDQGVYFFPNGRVQNGTLTKSTKIRAGVLGEIKVGVDNPTEEMMVANQINFHENGLYAGGEITDPLTMKLGFSEVQLPPQTSIYLAENGNLSSITPSHTISFRLNDRLACRQQEGRIFYFFEDSNQPRGCQVEGRYLTKEGLSIVGDIMFYRGEQVESGMISGDTFVMVQPEAFGKDKILLKGKSYIGFSENGKIKSGTIGEDTELLVPTDPINLARGSRFSIYDENNYKYLLIDDLRKSFSITTTTGYKCSVGLIERGDRAYYLNTFHLGTRHPASCLLDEDTFVKELNQQFKKDTILKFDSNGVPSLPLDVPGHDDH